MSGDKLGSLILGVIILIVIMGGIVMLNNMITGEISESVIEKKAIKQIDKVKPTGKKHIKVVQETAAVEGDYASDFTHSENSSEETANQDFQIEPIKEFYSDKAANDAGEILVN